MRDRLRRKICEICDAQLELTVGARVPKINFLLPNGVQCQASKSTGSLWASLSTLTPKQGGLQASRAFNQHVWTFRFKGAGFEIFLDGECFCPLCFIENLIKKHDFERMNNRMWVFNGHVFNQNSPEEHMFEETIKNNCSIETAMLLESSASRDLVANLTKTLGHIDPKKDTVGTLRKRCNRDWSWVEQALTSLGYEVYSNGTFEKGQPIQ